MAYRTIIIRRVDGTTITKRVDERGIVPAGGTAGQALVKLSADDFAVDWANVSPELTADELAALHGANGPSAENVFATMADVPPAQLTADELAAIQGAYLPSAENVFITFAEYLSEDLLGALYNADNPSASNVFITEDALFATAAENALEVVLGKVGLGGNLVRNTAAQHGNFVLILGNNDDFVQLGTATQPDFIEVDGITNRNYNNLAIDRNNNDTMYATIDMAGGDIYMRTTGDFEPMGYAVAKEYLRLGCVAEDGSLWVWHSSNTARHIYHITPGASPEITAYPLTGDLANLAFAYMAIDAAGNVWVTGRVGLDDYKLLKKAAAGTEFVEVVPEVTMWALTSDDAGVVYAGTTATGGGVYKMTGDNVWQKLGTKGGFYGMCVAVNGDIYASKPSPGEMYRMKNGKAPINYITCTPTPGYGMAAASNGDVYFVSMGGLFKRLPDPKGMHYGADYSGDNGSNPRWIPDCGWVQDAITAAAEGGSPELTADELAAIQGANAPSATNVFLTADDLTTMQARNGLTVDSGYVELGGTLYKNTYVSFATDETHVIQMGFSQPSAGAFRFSLQHDNGTTKAIYFDANCLNYAADYRALYTDRTLPDCKWVQDQIEAATPAPELTADQLAAVQGAAAPSASNVFATMDDLPVISDAAYGSSWDGNADGASKNAIYDKIETLTEVIYHPATMTVQYGTLTAGTVADLAAVGGTDVNITEVVGANAMQVQLDFTGVARFNFLAFYGRYAGGAGHQVAVEAYNNSTAAWDSLGVIGFASAKLWYSFRLFVPANYLNAGAVSVRLRHLDNGIGTHHTYLDYVELSYLGGSGFQQLTASEVEFVPAGNITSHTVQEAIEEVAGLIPDELADLADDTTHRTVTDTEKSTWNAKSNLAPDELAAIQGAASPSAANPFATMADLPEATPVSNAGNNRIITSAPSGSPADNALNAEEDLTYDGKLLTVSLDALPAGSEVVGSNVVAFNVYRKNATSDAYGIAIGLRAYLNKGGRIAAGGFGMYLAHWDGATSINFLFYDRALAKLTLTGDVAITALAGSGNRTVIADADGKLAASTAALVVDEVAAIQGAASPSAANPFATMADVSPLKNTFTINVSCIAYNPADNQSVCLGIDTQAPGTTFDTMRIYLPINCRLKGATFFWRAGSTAGSGENISIYIRRNNSTDTLVQTVGNTSATKVFSSVALDVAYNAGDYFEVKVTQPTWATNPTNVRIFGTVVFQPSASPEKHYTTMQLSFASQNPPTGQTCAVGIDTQSLAPDTGGTMRMYVPFACTIRAVYGFWRAATTAGSGENTSFNIRVNNTTSTLVKTIGDTNALKLFNNTSLAISLNAGDYFEGEFVMATWMTQPQGVTFNAIVVLEIN
jgi:hypothetical protein